MEDWKLAKEEYAESQGFSTWDDYIYEQIGGCNLDPFEIDIIFNDVFKIYQTK